MKNHTNLSDSSRIYLIHLELLLESRSPESRLRDWPGRRPDSDAARTGVNICGVHVDEYLH